MPLPNVSRLCGAHGRRSGKPCKNAAMSNGRCRMHGGTVGSGMASPRFKHGQYCKSLFGQIAGLGTVTLRDIIHADPEKLRRISDAISARLLLFGGRWIGEAVRREEEKSTV